MALPDTISMPAKTGAARTVLFIIAFLFLFIFPITWDSWIPRSQYTSVLLLGAAASVYLAMRSHSPKDFRVPKAVVPFVAYLLLQMGLLLIAPTIVPGLQKIVTNLVILALFLFFLESLNFSWLAWVWENALIGLGVLFSLMSLLVLFFWFGEWWRISGTLFSIPPIGVRLTGLILNHPNAAAGFINLVLPLAAIRSLLTKGALRRIFWICVIGLFLAAEYFTSSRGAWIGLVVGLGIVFGLIVLAQGPKFMIKLRTRISISLAGKRRMARAIGAGILTVIIGALIIYLLVWNVSVGGHGDFSERGKIWARAWNIFSTSPLWGHGPGSYPFYVALQSRDVTDENGYFHPHNLGLQIAGETGIAGLLLVVLFVGISVRAFIAVWRQTPSASSEKLRLAAYAGAAAAVAVQHIVDDLFLQMLYTLSVFLMLAIALRNAPRSEVILLKNSLGVFSILGLSGFVLLVTLYVMWGGSQYWQGLNQADKGDWITASEDICRAADMNAANTLFTFQCGQASAYAAYYDGDSDALQTAIAYTRRGLEKDPYWYGHWANLATFEWQAGRRSQGLALMRRAVANAPPSSLYLANLGWMEEAAGNRSEALKAYGEAIDVDPWLARDDYFQQSEVRRESLTGQRAEDDFWKGWDALQTGDWESAKRHFERAIESNPGDSAAYAALGLALQGAGRPGDAWRNVEKSLFIGGGYFPTLMIASQVALSQDRQDEALQYLTRAYNTLSNANTAYIYYNAAYHRSATLPSDLSPYLLRLGLTPGMRENLARLAEYFLRGGETAKAETVMDWVHEGVSQ
jgi:tetratricopeptide (TPR) repeat protein